MAITPSSSRYKRVTAALDEGAKERLWRNVGSEEPLEASPELSDLVDSFYGDGYGDHENGGEDKKDVVGIEREMLMGLVGCRDEEERRVFDAVEAVLGSFGMGAEEEEVKKKVVWWLRRRGFDAGLCKTKSDEDDAKTPRAKTFPLQSSHYYIDVITPSNARVIVELNISSEFQIARPTLDYMSLLSTFPQTFVGRLERLCDIVHLMCMAAAMSMRSRGMHVPPWRRKEHVEKKWLGSFNRSMSFISEDWFSGREEEMVMVGRRRVWDKCRGSDWEQKGLDTRKSLYLFQ